MYISVYNEKIDRKICKNDCKKLEGMLMKIGYIKDYYPEQRCIIDKVGGG